MLEKLNESSGPVIGFKVLGKVTVEDYQQLEPQIQALVDQYDDDVCVLAKHFPTDEIDRAWAWLREDD